MPTIRRPAPLFLRYAAPGAALVALLMAGAAARGQDAADPGESPSVGAETGEIGASKPTKTDPAKLGAEALAAFSRGEYRSAESLLRRQLEAQPENFVALYNLACCLSMQKDAPGASDALARSIENGFCDVYQLRRDRTLDGARGDPKFRALLDHWGELLDAHRDANELKAAALFKGREYVDQRDDPLKIAYRSAFNEKAFGQAREEVRRVAAWAEESLMPGILSPKDMVDDAWAVVVLPTRPDFARWICVLYGPDALRGNSIIGGAYEHDEKRLVCMDIGATMRHEFAHVLHWRSCTRLGQFHAIWVQEGVCSLVEDYDMAGGKLKPAPSWRTNIAKRLDKIGALMPIEKLAAMTPVKFSGQRPLANYAQARAFFLYLADQGKLKDWYAHYTAHIKEDPTGVQSIEAVLEKPIADVNREYRSWLRALPGVPESIKAGDASLGIEVDAGNGEGPVVASVDRKARNMPDSKTMLRQGDVITSIDGKATRDIAELVRVLGGFKVGDEVEVEYRRVKKFASTKVRLVPR